MQRGVHSSQQTSSDTHHKTPSTQEPALTDEALVQRALENGQSPGIAHSPAAMRALSRTMGNQALQRWMQRAIGSISQSPALVIQRDTDDQIVAHAYNKHVLGQGNMSGKEFGDPPISQDAFKTIAKDVRTTGEVKALSGNRTAYWKDGVIVIVNGNNPGASTCFKPTTGKAYFNKQT